MSAGGLTGAGGGSLAGTTPPPLAKQPDGASLISYVQASSPRPDGAAKTDRNGGSWVQTEEQSQKLRAFDDFQGRPNLGAGDRDPSSDQGTVRLAQASVGTLNDAVPETAGFSSDTGTSRVRVERSGQTGGSLLGGIAKKGLTKVGGVVTGILVPTNSSHDQILTIPGHPQYRISGKESEQGQMLQVKNADGGWDDVGSVYVTGDQNGTTVDMTEVNAVLEDRGFEPITLPDTNLPGPPLDGPKGPTILSTPDQSGIKVDVIATPNDGPRGAQVESFPIPEEQGPQIFQSSDNGEQSSDRGKLTGNIDSLTDEERDFVERELDSGRDVDIIPTGPNRSPDFEIDGVRTELKTISNVKNTTGDGISGAIASRAMDARGQATTVTIDLSQQEGVTQEIAERGVARAFGADNKDGAKIEQIRVVGPDFDITIPRK